MNPVIEIFEEMRKEDTDYLLYGALLQCTSMYLLMLIQQIRSSQPLMQCLLLKRWA